MQHALAADGREAATNVLHAPAAPWQAPETTCSMPLLHPGCEGCKMRKFDFVELLHLHPGPSALACESIANPAAIPELWPKTSARRAPKGAPKR